MLVFVLLKALGLEDVWLLLNTDPAAVESQNQRFLNQVPTLTV